MKKWLKRIVYVILGLLLLFLGYCMYNEISQQRRLERLCATVEERGSIQVLLADAAQSPFNVRTGGPTGMDENEWFDREYLRIGAELKETLTPELGYTVVFAKPAMGYYACFIIHEDDLILDAWFEDRSS